MAGDWGTKQRKMWEDITEEEAASAFERARVVISGDTSYGPLKRMKDLDISDELFKGLFLGEFKNPTNLEAIIWGLTLTPPHKSLMAQSFGGVGKTKCFSLAMLSRINPKIQATQALYVCTSRELGLHTVELIRKMAKFTGITSELLLPEPERSMNLPFEERPPITAQAVIGTPYTIEKAVVAKRLALNQVKIIVFNEGEIVAEPRYRDCCLGMLKLIAERNMDCQVIFFADLFVAPVKAFAYEILENIFEREYNVLMVKNLPIDDSVKQYKCCCLDEYSKIKVVVENLIEYQDGPRGTIVFVQNIETAFKVRDSSTRLGCKVAIDTEVERLIERDIEDFKSGVKDVFISVGANSARRVLARGILKNVNLVINFSPPMRDALDFFRIHCPKPDYEVYFQQICRLGSLGWEGVIFNLISDDRDIGIMAKLEEYFDTEVTKVEPGSKPIHLALSKSRLRF